MTRTPLALTLAAAVLAVAPSAASAAVTCGFDAGTHRLTIVADANDDNPKIRRSGQAITVSADVAVSCTGPAPTVDTTDAVDITDAAPSRNTVTVDLGGGALAPGFSPEGQFGTPEIEIDVDSDGSDTEVEILGSTAADHVDIGTSTSGETRANLNPLETIADADVVAAGIDAVSVHAGGGADVLDARGGSGTGDPLAGGSLRLDGGEDGDDLHAGATSTSVLSGGDDDDTLTGGPGYDTLLPGPGDDSADGAGGTDPLAFDQQLPGVDVDLAKSGPQDTGEGVDTVSGLEVLAGTNGDDVLRGTADANAIYGYGGDDLIVPRGGNDGIDAGDGTDTVTFAGAAAGVTATLDGANPESSGGDGSDFLLSIENVVGSPFADTITGSAVPNVLDGGGGDDTLQGRGGADRLNGGSGLDTASYTERAARVAVALDGVANDGADPDLDGTSDGTEEGDRDQSIENVATGAGNDRLRGGAGPNVLAAGAGTDTLDGGLGSDVLRGGPGVDKLSYAARTAAVAVTLDGLANDGADPNHDGLSKAGEERDQDIGIENAAGGAGDDRLKALGPAVNALIGGAGSDLLDTKDGSATVDQHDCGPGADTHRSDPSDAKTSCEVAS